jgi:hypothetical protein
MVLEVERYGSLKILQLNNTNDYTCSLSGKNIENFEPHVYNRSGLILSIDICSDLSNNIKKILEEDNGKDKLRFKNSIIKLVDSKNIKKCSTCNGKLKTDSKTGDPITKYIMIKPDDEYTDNIYLHFECSKKFCKNLKKVEEFFDDNILQKITDKVHICSDYNFDSNLSTRITYYNQNHLEENQIYVNFFHIPFEISNLNRLTKSLKDLDYIFSETELKEDKNIECNYCNNNIDKNLVHFPPSNSVFHKKCCEELSEELKDFFENSSIQQRIVAESII